jgi:hypothetical protein
MPDLPIREPDQIRRDAVRKLRKGHVSGHFQAILSCLFGEHWTTPWLVALVVTSHGDLLGRCDGEASHNIFLGSLDHLIKNIHRVAPMAELDGD